MKKVLRYLLIFLALLLTLFLYQLQSTKSKQADEAGYHAKLTKCINVHSADFDNNGQMPIDETDYDGNHSPQLSWDTLPAGTKMVAILATDYDAPSPNLHLFTASHWVVYNIPAGVHSLDKGITGDKLKEQSISVGKNYAGKHVYAGPRPPFGLHSYYFRVYALDFDHLFLSNDNRDELYKAMQGHILGYGELVGKYGHE